MNEGKVAITSRRLFIMVMALIAPELMITWATRQFFSARAAAKNFNDSHFDTTQSTKAYMHRDIPEGSRSPGAPKTAKFRSLLISELFS
jgi:hypothetical protein